MVRNITDTELCLQSKGKQTCKLMLRIAANSPTVVSSSAVAAPTSTAAVTNSLPSVSSFTAAVSTSTSVALASAMKPLSEVSTQLTKPIPAVTIADAMSAASDTVGGLAQSDLVASLTTLVDNLDFVVKLGDGLAKVCNH